MRIDNREVGIFEFGIIFCVTVGSLEVIARGSNAV